MSRRALVIDTAGPVIGAAAFVGERCVGSYETRIVMGADGWLLPVIRDLLDELGGLRAEDLVVVGVGPGAFTGVRVGVATALGLAESVGCRVHPVCSLALRAAAHPGCPRLVVALDARKGRVYTATYDTTGRVPACTSAERDLPPGEALVGEGAVTGEGAVVYEALLPAGLVLRPDAAAVGVNCAGALLADRGIDPGRLQLAYLRGEDQVVTLPRAGRPAG